MKNVSFNLIDDACQDDIKSHNKAYLSCKVTGDVVTMIGAGVAAASGGVADVVLAASGVGIAATPVVTTAAIEGGVVAYNSYRNLQEDVELLFSKDSSNAGETLSEETGEAYNLNKHYGNTPSTKARRNFRER